MSENKQTGDVHGPVVQAQHITGGVHVHPSAPDRIVPQQLPGVTWHFTGRTTELAELTSALDAAGTVVISPTEQIGGIGTTSLATRWATDFAARFPDGALYVNLRGSDPYAGRPVTPDEVVRGFLGAFGVPEPQGVDAQFGTYRSVLAGRKMLLLLDDARDAEQVRPLLPGNSGSRVIVTSRRPLPDLVATAGARPIALGPLPDEDARALLRRHVEDEQRLAAEPDAVTELIRLSGGVPLALNVLAAHAAAWRQQPLSGLVAELHRERDWLDLTDDSLAARTQVVYSWTRQRADTGPLPKPNWSNWVRSLVEWARTPQALVAAVAAVSAAFIGVWVSVIGQAGIFGVGYLALRVAALILAAVFLTRTEDRRPVGTGLAAAMAVYVLADSIGWLYSTSGVWVWLYLLAALCYLGVLGVRFWPFRELRRKPRFIVPATRPLAFLVLGGVFGQLVLLFVAVPVTRDGLSGTFTVSAASGALGALLFVVPVAALCVLVALTEPLDEPRRTFVTAVVVGFFGPELYLMLTSLVLGTDYTYVGDDVGGPGVTAVWYVLLNAVMFAAIGVGTVLIARSAVQRRR
jgi:MFS family permease